MTVASKHDASHHIQAFGAVDDTHHYLHMASVSLSGHTLPPHRSQRVVPGCRQRCARTTVCFMGWSHSNVSHPVEQVQSLGCGSPSTRCLSLFQLAGLYVLWIPHRIHQICQLVLWHGDSHSSNPPETATVLMRSKLQRDQSSHCPWPENRRPTSACCHPFLPVVIPCALAADLMACCARALLTPTPAPALIARQCFADGRCTAVVPMPCMGSEPGGTYGAAPPPTHSFMSSSTPIRSLILTLCVLVGGL